MNYANVWHGDVAWCHKVTELKGGTTEEVFQEQCFLWERGASVGAELDLFSFKDFLFIQAQEPLKHWKKAEKQYNIQNC